MTNDADRARDLLARLRQEVGRANGHAGAIADRLEYVLAECVFRRLNGDRHIIPPNQSATPQACPATALLSARGRADEATTPSGTTARPTNAPRAILCDHEPSGSDDPRFL